MCALRRRESQCFAAVVIAVVLIHCNSLFGDTEARLLDLQAKVKSAHPDLRYCHVGMLDAAAERPVREAWIALDDIGSVAAIQVNLHDEKQSLVWTEQASQMWRYEMNELLVFRDRLYTLKMLSFATRHHPRLVYTRLHELLTEPDIEVCVEDGDDDDPTTIAVTYGTDTYLVGAPKIPMRDVYTVDPETGRLSRVEVYAFVEEEYRKAATWVYFDNAKPAYPSVFDLRGQIHSGVRIIDTSHVEYGLKQDASSDEEVATRVVEAFFAAWKSQDAASMRNLLASIISSSADRVCETVMKQPPPHVVKIGVPVKKVPYLGLFVPVTLEFAGDPPEQGQITFLASPKDRDRWHIAHFTVESGQSRKN